MSTGSRLNRARPTSSRSATDSTYLVGQRRPGRVASRIREVIRLAWRDGAPYLPRSSQKGPTPCLM